MFYIQDPRCENGQLLNEALLEACENALYGAGTYAFVSADGIDLLMNNHTFENFMKRGLYHLIIGMDDITNIRTLAALQRYCGQFPNLRADAFIHHTTGSTFHPKYSWFKYEKGGALVLGSGNLTAKGLRRNTEAFVVQKLNEEEILSVEKKWYDWINCSKGCIKALQDPEVILKAGENMKEIAQDTKTGIWTDEQAVWRLDPDSEIFIWEMESQSYENTNPYKMKIDILTGNTFFGTEYCPDRKIIIRRVSSQGLIDNIESMNIHFTSDKIYQVELPFYQTEAKGNAFVIFARICARTFLYTLIQPEERGYRQLQKQLRNQQRNAEGLIAYRTNAGELKEKINSLAILQYLKK
ncbi:phospholipase D family protein [Aminipila terrae]|uniref:Phospholipase D-like domain-containing protein n=1 Tax=Aminipila terrae TaxID=2697030 RepID=A0A6P1MCK0_9FIRM|nr:phospholipase D family protein [Aminipila terrae]QHI71742.1 hypothetical protein Ami3637_04490 [Aminipila terrae]